MTDALSALRIDPDRLRADLDAVNAIGTIPGLPGINRPSFSDADMAGRRWLLGRMAEAGLAARMDAVGNVIGRWAAGTGSAVLAGSHLDTVPMGGRFDGTLGVCAALEAVRAMRDAGLSPRRPVEVIAFADEEGRFGGMLGSEAVCGLLTAARMAAAVDETGVRLTDAMRAQRLDPDCFAEAARDPAEVAVFLELHIEQGPILAQAGETVGVVEGVSGVFHWVVTLRGEANHSGTTPMDARRDAFRGLAAFGASIDAILADAGGPDTRLTVGKVALAPNFPHSIAGEAVFTIIGRDPDEAMMRRLAERCRAEVDHAATSHGLAAAVDERSLLSPTRLDPAVAEGLAQDAVASGLAWRRMVSGAGHDAQTMARRFPSGLIFAPSIGGVSHAPAEDTAWPDAAAAAAVLARAVARCACA